MKKFIIKILSFVLFFCIIFCINCFINDYYIKHEDLGLDCETLILGESHVKSGINPDYIPNSKNVAQPAESILLTYYKLKKIQKHHPIRNVALSLGHNTLSAFNDGKFKNPHFAYEFTQRAYPLMTWKEMHSAGADWRTYIKIMIKHTFLFPKKEHRNFIGGFNPKKNKFKNKPLKKHIQRHYYDEDKKLYPISNTSISYIDSIIHFCQEKNIELFFINTPQHKDYYSKIPPHIQNAYSSVKEDLQKRNVNFIDLHDMDIGEEYLSDYDHLNSKGADKVSKLLFEKMKAKQD